MLDATPTPTLPKHNHSPWITSTPWVTYATMDCGHKRRLTHRRLPVKFRLVWDAVHVASVQLEDLRRVVARMLAVDCGTHTVPDYEIISRLEKLILAMQASSSPGMTLPLDDVVQLSDQFRSGYCTAGRVLADAPQPRVPTKPGSGRARPCHRRVDSKIY